MQLTNLLKKLSEETIKICESWKNSKKIIKKPSSDVRYDIREKKIGDTSICYLNDLYLLQKYFHDDISKLVNFVEKKSDLFKETANILKNTYNIGEPEAKRFLSQFLEILIINCLESEVDTEGIQELIDVFREDLEDKPTEWKIKTLLIGIEMRINEIEIDDGIILRKIQPQDLEFQADYMKNMNLLRFYPFSVLEINKKMNLQCFICPELEKTIITLQLYKNGPIQYIFSICLPRSILKNYCTSGFTLPNAQLYSNYNVCRIDAEDVALLPKFVRKIKPLLPVEEKTGSILSKVPCGLAISFYQDAIFKHTHKIQNMKFHEFSEIIKTEKQPEKIDALLKEMYKMRKKIDQISIPERMIINCILGLETLYLDEEEKECLDIFCSRVAKVLEFLNESPTEITKTINKAHIIKKHIFNGFSHKQKGIKEAWNMLELLNKIIEYLRKSILVFLQVGKKKNVFLHLIDKAMVDKRANENLRKLIKEHVEVIGRFNEINLI